MQVLCHLSNASRNNGPHRTLLTTYLVALHAMLGKFGLVASCAVEVFPLREEASSPNDLLAVAAGEAVFVPDGPLVLHVLISCEGGWVEKQLDSPTECILQGLHPLGSHPGLSRGEGMQALQLLAPCF